MPILKLLKKLCCCGFKHRKQKNPAVAEEIQFLKEEMEKDLHDRMEVEAFFASPELGASPPTKRSCFDLNRQMEYKVAVARTKVARKKAAKQSLERAILQIVHDSITHRWIIMSTRKSLDWNCGDNLVESDSYSSVARGDDNGISNHTIPTSNRSPLIIIAQAALFFVNVYNFP